MRGSPINNIWHENCRLDTSAATMARAVRHSLHSGYSGLQLVGHGQRNEPVTSESCLKVCKLRVLSSE